MRARGRTGGSVTWAAAAATCAVVVACSSSSSAPTPQPAPQAICPTTPEDTIGVACAVPGLTCGPQYACGASTVALFCVCTSGAFQCADGLGDPVAAGAMPACPDASATSTCPANERVAELAACTEQGLICSYPSSCPSMLDQCQCAPGTTASGAFGLRFECHPLTCIDAGVTVDASVHDAGGGEAAADGGDATTNDSGPTPMGDAASDALSPADATGGVLSPLDAAADGSPGDAAAGDAGTE